jgi:hypothetical protein
LEVKVLPPGEAEGARDLQRWANRRAGGRSGVPMTKMERSAAKKRKFKNAGGLIAQAKQGRRHAR